MIHFTNSISVSQRLGLQILQDISADVNQQKNIKQLQKCVATLNIMNITSDSNMHNWLHNLLDLIKFGQVI